MTTEQTSYIFKGEGMNNRYRITGKLVTQSPLHIGSGSRRKLEENGQAEQHENGENNSAETHHVDEIQRDFRNLPFLPGSSLRGVVRHYLLQIFRGFNPKIAAEQDYESSRFRNMEQQQCIAYTETEASLLEQLFGTPCCESKVEFWDAPLAKRVSAPPEFEQKGWNENWQSYTIRSVAIDPQTGAAEQNKLYAFDVVPEGAEFALNIVGQNLSDVELGFLFFGLYGFNSEIYPLTLGAMAGRGFGKIQFVLDAIYYLSESNISEWVKLATTNNHAGYRLFEHLKPLVAEKAVERFKSAFLERI